MHTPGNSLLCLPECLRHASDGWSHLSGRLLIALCSCSALKEAGKARGLPSGVLLQDLVPSKTEAIPPTHDDGNPEVGCEFFETRQVLRLPAVLPLSSASIPHL